MTERAELKERFEQMDDDELLRRYRSGDMTELAEQVAAEALRERNLSTDLLPAPDPSAPERMINHAHADMDGDVVCLTRVTSPIQAELLCGLLESEGVYAMAADSNLVRVNSMLTQALGGIRIMVRESELERARDIEQAFRRGDFAIPSDD